MNLGFTLGVRKWAIWRMAVCLVVLASVAVLPGCDDEKTRDVLDQRSQEAQRALEDMRSPTPAKHYNPLVVTDKVWTGDSALRMHRGMPLPPKYETPHGITIVSSENMTLAELAADITDQTGIPVHLSEVGAAKASASNTAAMPVAYEGPLSGLMERMAGYFGVNWRYDGSSIMVARFETRVFTIEALPGNQSIQEGMQDDSSSGGVTSSGGVGGGTPSSSSTNSITQNSKFNIDFKYWDELGQTLNSMLGGNGTLVVSPSIGTVTVTTTPEIMHTISDYLSAENQRLSRQIAINVEIYSVTLNEGMDFTVAFNTLLRRLTNFGANFSGAPGPATPTISGAVSGGGSLSVSILNPLTTYDAITGQKLSTGPGSITDIFTALSAIGDTTEVARFPLVTLNNRPVSRRVGEDISYVASATSSNASTGSTTSIGTSLTPGTVHQGFSVQLTPRLLDDGRILLEYSLSVIDVKEIKTFNSVCGDTTGTSASDLSSACTGSGVSTIESPDTLNRIFVQQSVLKSGSMLLLGGAEEEDVQQNSQGVGNPYNYLLGGGVSSAKSHSMLIFAITPQVLETPHSEND